MIDMMIVKTHVNARMLPIVGGAIVQVRQDQPHILMLSANTKPIPYYVILVDSGLI